MQIYLLLSYCIVEISQIAFNNISHTRVAVPWIIYVTDIAQTTLHYVQTHVMARLDNGVTLAFRAVWHLCESFRTFSCRIHLQSNLSLTIVFIGVDFNFTVAISLAVCFPFSSPRTKVRAAINERRTWKKLFCCLWLSRGHYVARNYNQVQYNYILHANTVFNYFP